MTYLLVFPVLFLAIKFIEHKWKQAGTAVPIPMRKMALAMIGLAAILLIYSAEKKQNAVRTANYFTVRTVGK